MTDKNTPVIAFVGLGSMGLGMAKNLLKHGHKVIGVDPSAAARDAFVAAGGSDGRLAGRGRGKTADVVVVAVVNAQQVETVLYGEGGAASAPAQGWPRDAVRHLPRRLHPQARRAPGRKWPRAARRADVGRTRARGVG